MPAKDGTGPMGMGPGTGRRIGECAGNADVESVHAGPGQGCGTGHGRGRGFGMGPGRGRGRGGGRGRCYRGGGGENAGPGPGRCESELTREQEVETLRQQAEHLKKAHEDACERIKELETTQKE